MYNTIACPVDRADLEAVLRAFPPDKKQEALQEIQTRITNVMFVELLFAKGPREAEMINREYNWEPAVQRKMTDLGFRDPAQQGILPPLKYRFSL